VISRKNSQTHGEEARFRCSDLKFRRKPPSSDGSRQIQPKIVGFTRSVLRIIVKSSSSRESHQIQKKIVRFSRLARWRHLSREWVIDVSSFGVEPLSARSARTLFAASAVTSTSRPDIGRFDRRGIPRPRREASIV
jgi:hypothetical protein